METIFNRIVTKDVASNGYANANANAIASAKSNKNKDSSNSSNDNSSNDNESKVDDTNYSNKNKNKNKNKVLDFDQTIAQTKNMIIGSEVTIPIKNGKLNMGTWQGIWLCEHTDNDKDGRSVVVTITGVPNK